MGKTNKISVKLMFKVNFWTNHHSFKLLKIWKKKYKLINQDINYV